MAEQLPTLFQGLTTQMGGLNSTIQMQGVKLEVPSFDGSDPKSCRRWLKLIEKYSKANGLNLNQMKDIAYRTSDNAVSDFLERLLENYPNFTWAEVKAEILVRFADVSDSQTAFMLLHKIKQEQDEDVPLYAHRLQMLADQAYADTTNDQIQSQLVNFFVDGLNYDYLKIKVMRENPTTLQAAVNTALTELRFRKRVGLRTGNHRYSRQTFASDETPMDVDHYRPRMKCQICKRTNHTTKQCRARKQQVNEVQTNRRADIICWGCGRKGHNRRDCRTHNSRKNEQEN